MIDKATVQRIKDTANIVEVVSDYVHLIRRGSNYMGLCPFHNERTPSFSVNPRRNICHCFSCGKGGSPINFIMQKENISYHDALKQLAKKYGIKVEERELTPEERRRATEREGLLIAAEAAMKQMEDDLTATQEGRDIGLTYLYGRGVTDEAIKAFHLGYAIDKGNHLTGILQRQGFDLETLKSLGITGTSQAGNLYDKYRGRVIFPIMNSFGKVVGFGGRDLKGGPAKYINSPESVLYRKNNELYGIYQAKNEIVRQGECFLVEGYLDVISMWQSGLKNVVASSGTSLTDGQIAMIHRFASNITLVYDGDSAGIKAALRGIDMLLSHKLKVKVLLLPDGHDPDSFARQTTPEEFRDFVEKNSCDIITFKMEVLVKDAGDDPQKRAQVVNSVVESIACIPDGIQRTVYISECARKMNIEEGAVAAAVERARGRILEQQALERRRKEAQRLYPDPSIQNTDAKSPSTDVSADAQANNPAENMDGESAESSKSHNLDDSLLRSISRRTNTSVNQLLPLEERMIEVLIRYGYMDWDKSSSSSEYDDSPIEESQHDSDKDSQYFTFLDFIKEELEADDVSFTDARLTKIYSILIDNIPDFFEAYRQHLTEVNSLIDRLRKEGHNEISNKSLSISEIERAEKKLEEELSNTKEQKLTDFARLYPGDYLASHEDDDVRETATRAIREKYVLSKIYKNIGNPSSDNEVSQVTRALIEWKSAILNRMLMQEMEKLAKIQEMIENNDFESLSKFCGERIDEVSAIEKEQQQQLKITNMMKMRSHVAKDLGDRILSNYRK